MRERVFGFEILPAPFVISHLQLGLELESLGAPLADRGDPPERVGVYLTNALTGWEPPQEPKTKILFPEMEQERDAADHIKRAERVLVIIGNPPYNGFSGIAVKEERDLSTAYRTSKKVAPPQGQGLNDLYVRFFRMAERRIVELNKPARGVVCFISNYSWLDGLSFTGMREHFLDVFDKIWIDSLNGDKYKTGKLTPEGESDPSIFSTEFNREGIQVGTAIALLARHAKHAPKGEIKFRNLWGKTKREQLADVAPKYDAHKPAFEMGLSLMPGKVDSGYLAGPLIPDRFPASFSGVKTARDGSLVAIEEATLRKRMAAYFDPKLTNAAVAGLVPELMADDARFNAAKTRDYLLKRGVNESGFVKYYYRPYDVRWLYWDPETKLLDEKRSEYFSQVAPNNPCMVLAQRTRKGFFPPIVTSSIVSYHVIESVSLAFTLFVKQSHSTLLSGAGIKPNISDRAADYLSALKAESRHLFFHSVAVMHSPAFQVQNSGALGQDWPRIPLPKKKDDLLASAELGRRIAALLDPESPFDGLTNRELRDDLKKIAVFERLDGKPAKPERGDLDLTAGWGHAGKGGVTMPGRGKAVVREGGAVDVFLNDQACWRNIPESVWEYTIGGYQVIKKWLSYREKPLLDRGLTSKEIRYVTEMARRIAVLVSMRKNLDENYRVVIKSTYAWPK
jgi:predicted helicase